MNLSILKITSIRSKKDLHDFYDFQMNAKTVTAEIQEIIKKNRNIPATEKEHNQLLKPKEVLLFIIDNGYPNGYVPDDEVKQKIEEMKTEQLKLKRQLFEIDKTNNNYSKL